MAHLPAPLLRPRYAAASLALVLLSGCEIPGLGPDPRLVQKEAEAKAIGGACRHALRGLEDCFTLNPKAAKASVFAGWKDMDQYMRDNKLEGSPSVLGKLEAKPDRASRGSEAGESGESGAASRNRS
ncbi:hypothetical protein AVHY2522_15805 [Acidovorax sp. SUPP2522]|uniref:hypothetical protein n=1 Tax=unclassified Acidovorax TaxID=2684926 RepID=UPI00234AC05E|nr:MULTISPECIES: hypothetical protein [unclassified Acidovorax]WCM95677.1 hypothetical protein M5C96_14420 [Acidovorax sp. GBBC 1281]GKT17611.1 hypothetical protein AVHY2522_15805 [Acidovorax sp. SUPP2522]